jgi:CheY-like chemotaxis protein
MAEKKALILIAEDQTVNQELFCLIIERLGHSPLLAENGEDAVEIALKLLPDLMFMDLSMPKLNGWEAAEILRKSAFKNPIIAITAGTLSDDWENCQKAGINDIMLKPIAKSSMEKMIQRWLHGCNKPGRKPAALPQPPLEAVFKPQVMLCNFMNEKELALSLLDRFIKNTEAQLEAIQRAIEAFDWKNIRDRAHMIKGTSLTLGGSELGKMAKFLEASGKNGQVDEVKSAYSNLCLAFKTFKAAAESYISLEGQK